MTISKRAPILYLDTLPVLSAEEVGGFGKAATRRRGVLLAATLSEDGDMRLFRAHQCEELVIHLRSAKRVIGYNCTHFDYELIRGMTPFPSRATTDLILVIQAKELEILSFVKAARKYLGCKDAPRGELAWKNLHSGDEETAVLIMRRRLELFAQLHHKLCKDNFP